MVKLLIYGTAILSLLAALILNIYMETSRRPIKAWVFSVYPTILVLAYLTTCVSAAIYLLWS